MADPLPCRACGALVAPLLGVSHLICAPCWQRVPPRLRVAAVVAYGRRKQDPLRHSEALAGVLLWCNEQRAGSGVEPSAIASADERYGMAPIGHSAWRDADA